MDQRLAHQQPPGLPLVSLVNLAVKLAGVAGPPVRVTLKQRKADTRAVIQHPAVALVDPGKRRRREAGVPRRLISQLQHGHVQPSVRYHATDVRRDTIAGTDHPKPGRWLTGGLIAGAMLSGQHQSAADEVAGAQLLPSISQRGDHRDDSVHPDR